MLPFSVKLLVPSGVFHSEGICSRVWEVLGLNLGSSLSLAVWP